MLTTPLQVAVLDMWPADGLIKQWREIVKPMPFGWFQSPDWVIPWWAVNGKNKEPLLMGVFDSKRLVAIAPWFVTNGIIRCMGDPLNDINCIPIRPGYHDDQILFSIVSGIELALSKQVRSLVLECWNKPIPLRDIGTWNIEVESTQMSPVLHLPHTDRGYLDQLSMQKRHRLAQCLRRMEQNVPGVLFDVPSDSNRRREVATTMLQLREESLAPRGLAPDCEPLSRLTAFEGLLALLIENDTTASHVVVTALRYGDEIIAGGLYFLWNESLLKYMQGWNMKFRSLSPGTVLDVLTIDSFVRRGLHRVEFGRGAEPYKSRLGAEPQVLYDYTVQMGNAVRPAR